MKAKEDVINGIIARFSSELDGVWENGYQQGKEKGYESGYIDGSKKKVMETLIEVGKEKEKEIYQKGLNDAWETAKKINMGELNGGINFSNLERIFGTSDVDSIMVNNTPSEAEEKIHRHEQMTQHPLKTNAAKFLEVFGEAKADAIMQAYDRNWWDEIYEEQ